MSDSHSCPPPSGCRAPNRRDFLRFASPGAASLVSPCAFAGPFEPDADLGRDPKHPVPFDKMLSAASLTARGKPSAGTDWVALQQGLANGGSPLLISVGSPHPPRDHEECRRDDDHGARLRAHRLHVRSQGRVPERRAHRRSPHPEVARRMAVVRQEIQSAMATRPEPL